MVFQKPYKFLITKFLRFRISNLNLTWGNKKGVALFMVIAAITTLAIVVTEFTYISQVNQKLAFDALDRVKTFYLAKSGFKLSLLRLRAYQKIKKMTSGENSNLPIPKSVVEKIWNFPFMFPIPSELPGLSGADKELINKFHKESNLKGSFTAVISSESSKFNINQILSTFSPKEETKKKEEKKPGKKSETKPQKSDSETSEEEDTTTEKNDESTEEEKDDNPNETKKYDPKEARKTLYDFLSQIMNNKFEEDADFASEYRAFNLEDLMGNIFAWIDITFEAPSTGQDHPIKPKQAPMYHLSELHMVPFMDDKLYDLFSPSLTTFPTPGININTINEITLQALVPQMKKEDLEAFFKYRDDPQEGVLFNKDEEFFSYLSEKVEAFTTDENELKDFKESLTKKNIRIVTEENQFKITVRAKLNQASSMIESWVTLVNDGKTNDKKTAKNDDSTAQGDNEDDEENKSKTKTTAKEPENKEKGKEVTGLKITFMNIL